MDTADLFPIDSNHLMKHTIHVVKHIPISFFVYLTTESCLPRVLVKVASVSSVWLILTNGPDHPPAPVP